jgi:hypothetical protein
MAKNEFMPKEPGESEEIAFTEEEEDEIGEALRDRLGLTEDEWSTFIYDPNEFSRDQQKEICNRIAKNLRVPETHFRFGLGAGLEKSKRLSHRELRFLANKWGAD